MGSGSAEWSRLRARGEGRLKPIIGTDESRAGRALIWKSVHIGGTKLLYLAGTILLGRLLTPEDFGLVAIAVVAVTAAMAATDTGMLAALVQANERRRQHYDVAWSVGLLRGLTVSVALALLAPWIAELFEAPRALPLLLLIALKPLIDSLASPRVADLMRELKFKPLALISVGAVVVELGVSVGLATSYGGKAIILGRLAGALSVTLLGYYVAPYRPVLQFNAAATRELVAFGRWILAIGLTAVIADFLVQALVAHKLGIAELGMLSLATKLAILPIQSTEVVTSVAFPLYARLQNEAPRLGTVFRAHFVAAMMLLLPTTAILVGVAQPLERYVLGAAWVGTATMIAMLALAFSLSLLFNTLVPLLKGTGCVRELFCLELLQYAVLLTGIGIFVDPLGLIGVAASWAIGSLVVSAAALILAIRQLNLDVWTLFQPATYILSLSVVSGVAASVSASTLGGAFGAVVGGVLGVCACLGLAVGADRWLHTGFREAVGTFFPSLLRVPRS